MKPKPIHLSALLAMASSPVAFGLTTAYVNFDNQPATLVSPVSSDPSVTVVIPGVATFSGGVVGSEASKLNGTYVTLPNAYGTAFVPGGTPNSTAPLLSTLTISVASSFNVDEVSFPVFNGVPEALSYQVDAYDGSTMVASQTLSDIPAYNASLGAGDPDVGLASLTASKITSVTVTPTTFPDGGWDFIIDSVAFNEEIVPSLIWDNAGGANPSDGVTWDINSNNNWNNTTDTTIYADGDAVTFNDTNNSHYSVTLNSTVHPAGVTFLNSSGNYTLTGSGSIAGSGALTVGGNDSVTLDTVNTYTGGTTVLSGTLIAPVSGSLPNGYGLVNDGITNIYGNETLGSSGISALAGNGTLNIGNGPPTVVHLAIGSGAASQGALTIAANSSLDIGNNHLILSDSGGSIDSAILGYLTAGYNDGKWNGVSTSTGSIITSAPTGTTYGIGWADGALGGISGISSGQLEIKYTLYGDTNLDGTVNSVDFGTLAANFGTSGKNWAQGAFTYNGTVNSVDFGLLANNFGKSLGSNGDVTAADWAALDAFAQANGLMSEVPEPAADGLIVAAGLGFLACRQRRNGIGTSTSR